MERDRHALVSLAGGLAVLLVLVKLALLPFPVETLGDFLRWAMRLGLVVAADLCFVAALAVVFTITIWSCKSRPRLAAVNRAAMLITFYLAGLYGVLAYSMYSITLVPFTIRLLSFAGGPVMMADSIAKYVTWRLVASLLVAPVVLLLLPRIVRRLPQVEARRAWRWPAAVTAGLVIVLYGAGSQAYIQSHWTEPARWERRISQSPHAVLLGSCVEELFKSEAFTANILLNDVDERDFQPRSQRDLSIEAPVLPDSVRQNRPKNVVVFFLESSGAEYLSLHGGKHETTPHVTRLAQEKGVMFENLYVSVPNSCKSIVALTSSVYPRLDWKLIVRDNPRFDVPAIQQVLAAQGYRTCFAHSGYWSWRNRDNYLRERGAQTLIDAETMPEHRINSWGVSDKAMFQSTLNWIDAKPDSPFFLLAYTIETHHPYARPEHPLDFDVPDPELNDYLNAVRATDERIAWFVNELAKRGLEESTLVVVTTDHGESFGQHNQREHMFGVYQPNVHIPLVLLHPSLKDLPVRRISGVREQIDLAPTILDLLGYDIPLEWQGRNLFRADDDRPAYFFCVGNNVVLGLRDGQWKYHYYVDSGQEELFDLTADPGEEQNLAAANGPRCVEYRRRVGGLVRFQRPFLTRHGAL